jgi:DNA polymerase III alpha subunit (gram-positive type)
MVELYIDVETGGLSPYTDGLCQLCIIDNNEKVIFNEFLKPQKGKFYYKTAFQINNLNFQMLKKVGLSKTEFIEKLQYKLEEYEEITFIGHNISFDLGFLSQLKLNLPPCLIIDTMEKGGELKKLKLIDSKALKDTFLFYYPNDEEIHKRAHYAFWDCLMTKKIHDKIKEEEEEKLKKDGKS